MEEIPAGGCSYIYLVGDFSFGRLPEDEQLLVVPFVMRTLRVAGRPISPLHPEDEEVAGIRLRYSGYREEGGSDSFFTIFTTRYFSLYERPGWIKIPSRQPSLLAELGEENVLGLISRTLFMTRRVVTLRGMKSFVVCRFQLGIRILTTTCGLRLRALGTIQKFRSLANWIFHSLYDFVGGTIRQAAALGFLGSKVPKRLQRRVEIWMTGERRSSISRSLAVEFEQQLLSVVRMAAVNHKARYYMLRKARYPASRAEDMRRREVKVERSTAWALARNEAAAFDSNSYPYSPTSPARNSGECHESSDDELFSSD